VRTLAIDELRAQARGEVISSEDDRLVQVKRAYDPDNLFHLNQNIQP
jgi:FAD/FMN-containing dehydrogenase